MFAVNSSPSKPPSMPPASPLPRFEHFDAGPRATPLHTEGDSSAVRAGMVGGVDCGPAADGEGALDHEGGRPRASAVKSRGVRVVRSEDGARGGRVPPLGDAG